MQRHLDYANNHLLLSIKRFFSILLFVCTFFTAGGQEVIKHFATNDGLLSMEVYYVHCDIYGCLWFCTDRGISRYNGYEFENFTTQDGISHNVVFKVFEDLEHNLWFCCLDGSIFIRDHKSKQFRDFAHNGQLKGFLGDYNWIQAMTVSADSLLFFPPIIAIIARPKNL